MRSIQSMRGKNKQPQNDWDQCKSVTDRGKGWFTDSHFTRLVGKLIILCSMLDGCWSARDAGTYGGWNLVRIFARVESLDYKHPRFLLLLVCRI